MSMLRCTSLRQYPAKKERIFGYILRSYTITLEVFLHRKFGERYLSWFRAVLGFLFLYLLAHLIAPWYWQKTDYAIKPGFSLYGKQSDNNKSFLDSLTGNSKFQPSFSFFQYAPEVSENEWSLVPLHMRTKESLEKYNETLSNLSSGQISTFQLPSSQLRIYKLHCEWREAFSVLGIVFKIPIFADIEADGVQLLAMILFIYISFAEWRLLEIFLGNRLNSPPSPRSSGEPFEFWDIFYLGFHKARFQVDLVKQVCEPLLCFLFGGLVIILFPSSAALRVIAIWLFTGSFALFLKAYIENRARKNLYLDRIGNEMDLEGLRMQQRLRRPGPGGAAFTEVKFPAG